MPNVVNIFRGTNLTIDMIGLAWDNEMNLIGFQKQKERNVQLEWAAVCGVWKGPKGVERDWKRLRGRLLEYRM